MAVAARRVFRIGLATALSLAVAYGLGLPLPFLAPLLVLMLAASPAPPPGFKALLGLLLLVLVTLGIGLLLIPLLTHYAVSGYLVVALGLYLSAYVSVILGKGPVGALLAVGFTMIPAAGTVDFGLALAVIQALVVGIGLAVLCLRIVYPWFPEPVATGAPSALTQAPNEGGATPPSWIAFRSALIVLPPFFVLLVNPAMYMPIIMKTVLLGQQASVLDARAAGRELLGSTFLAGCCAVLFWFGLKVWPSLWMFFWWMLLFGIYFGCKLYGLLPSRFPPSFWQNTAVTMLILLGPAVEDSSNGKDVYQAFAVRMGLFVAVTLYAWAAVLALEALRKRRTGRAWKPAPVLEPR